MKRQKFLLIGNHNNRSFKTGALCMDSPLLGTGNNHKLRC